MNCGFGLIVIIRDCAHQSHGAKEVMKQPSVCEAWMILHTTIKEGLL